MILTFTAPEGQEPYRIDAGALNNELAAALGGWLNGWSASHNASQAIITLDDSRVADEQLVRDTVAAHVANTDARELAIATRKQADLDAHEAAKADVVVKYLVNHTPAECAAYVQTNVTNLAQAKDMLAKFAMALSVLSRKEFR
jgi:hypothetical protein